MKSPRTLGPLNDVINRFMISPLVAKAANEEKDHRRSALILPGSNGESEVSFI